VRTDLLLDGKLQLKHASAAKKSDMNKNKKNIKNVFYSLHIIIFSSEQGMLKPTHVELHVL